MKPVITLVCFITSISLAFAKGEMHPKSQIDFVKTQIKQKNDRFLSAYDQLIIYADSALNAGNHALADFSVPGYYKKPLEHRKNSLSLQTDAFNAYACALAYRLNGEKKYGEKACELLNAWASINKQYSEYDGTLVMSYSGTGLAIAAQLMQNTPVWKKKDQAQFDQWLASIYRKACNEIRNRKNNWADWGRFGSVLCAAYLNDQAEMDENIRLIKSDLFLKIDKDGSMPHEISREANGIWYTYFSLAPITAASWVIYTATGENIFALEQNGISLKSAIDYLYYYNLHPDEWKWFANPNKGLPSTWPGNLLEAMSGIYKDNRYADYVKPNRPQVYARHHFAWTFPTLMPVELKNKN